VKGGALTTIVSVPRVLRKWITVKKVAKMKRKIFGQIITYSPLAGIIGASLLNLSKFQSQLLMLLLLVWASAFFLYKSWLTQ
jgi:hypothetical protein